MPRVIKAVYTRFAEQGETAPPEKGKQPELPREPGAGAEPEADFQAAYAELISAAQDEVGLMLQDAREEALTLVRETERQAEAIRETARTEGRREGLAQAARETEDILRDGQNQIDALLAKGAQEHTALLDGMEPRIYGLALEIAEKILQLELDRNDEAFMSMLHNALENVRAESSVTLRVNLREYERFFGERQIKLYTSRGQMDAEVVIDPLVEQDGLMIETESGTIDAGAKAQLEQIRAGLGFENL